MMSILLPSSSSRATLRGFWLFVSVLAGLVVGVAAPLLGPVSASAGIAAGAATATVVAMPGLIFPSLVWLPYRAWNRLARTFGARTARYVTAVCFFTVMLALHRTVGARTFERSSDEPSMWRPRGTQPPEAYASQYHQPTGADSDPAWAAPLRGWMRQSGHRWAWALLPFLALIRLLDTDGHKRHTPSRHIYTLY